MFYKCVSCLMFLVFCTSGLGCSIVITMHKQATLKRSAASSLPADIRNQLLLAYGLNVVANFGQILLDPENRPAAKQHAAGMLQNVVDFVQTAIRSRPIQ